jgi:hypothetical protein
VERRAELDRDTDEFCTAVLKEIAELNKQLSAQITKRVGAHPKVKGDKTLRKLSRIAIVYMEHRGLYESAVENLRKSPEWRITPPDNTVSAIYRNIYKLITQISYPGSVESKLERKW